MKKQLILSASMFLASAMGIQAANTIDLRGTVYEIDTVFHAKVGPGTTQTHLALQSQTSAASKLQVFYLTIEKNTPGVSMRSVCSKDMVAGNETTSAMAQRKSGNGILYFAGTNGDFYATSGTAANGNSIIGTPTGANIIDGEIFRTSNNNDITSTQQFVVDTSGKAHVGHMDVYDGTATIGDKVTRFRGVNVNSRSSALTLYTYRYYGVTNQTSYADECAEVTAKLVEGEKFQAGGKFKLEITSTPTSTGNSEIPADGFVLHGRGTGVSGKANVSAIDFVNGLKVGDIVEIDNYISINGVQIEPYTAISGNPHIIGGGVVLDTTEVNRGDASGNHPRTGIGYSVTGDSIIMMVVDGRQVQSGGVRTSNLGRLMQYAKAYEAINIDGGGSSTLYTAALGVRNSCSDGKERANGNAIYAVIEAPEDNEIAEIRFMDWSMLSPKYGLYTPVIYGYNKYGVMISDNVTDYTLSCPAELGEIVQDGKTLFGNGSGTYALTATYGDNITATLPVTIDATNSPEMKYTDVLLDNYRKWTVEIQSLVGEEYMPVNSEALSWTSSDESVASINELGEVTGLKDGKTILSGVVGNFSGNVNLTVECPTAGVMPIDDFADLASWKVTKSGLGTATISVGENGSMKADFTITNTRSSKLTLAKTVQVWSLPDKIRLRIKPGSTTFTDISVKATPSNSRVKTISLTGTEVAGEMVYEFPVTELDETNSIGMYPIEFGSVIFTVSGATSTDYSFEVSGLEAIYDNVPAGVEAITPNKNDKIYITSDNVLVLGDLISDVFIYTISGQLVDKIVASGNYSFDNLTSGIYILKVKNEEGVSTVKFVK